MNNRDVHGAKTTPVGEHALLIELQTNAEVLSLDRFLRQSAPLMAGVREVVPGHDSLLIIGRDRRPSARLLESWSRSGSHPEDARLREIPVVYDGPDLESVADECRRSVADVVQAHQRARYRVGFIGFSPGFAYLLGLPHWLHTSRHSLPRSEVPAGSVAIAGEYTAVYPHKSPGGWKLIGRTDVQMFDLDREEPSFLQPGDAVRFVASC